MMKVYTNYEFVAYYIMLKHVKNSKIKNKKIIRHCLILIKT
jgi:hypothetical protein